MFLNKAPGGRNNLCGTNIAYFRKELNMSQRELSVKLQLSGLDIDKNAVQRIESGKRFVTDIELRAFSRVLGKSLDELLEERTL